MAEIKQSTSIQCSKKDLLDFFSQSLPLITLNSDAPSLIYHISEDQNTQQKLIHWSLYQGLYHVKWVSAVSQHKPFEFMQSELFSGPHSSPHSSPFSSPLTKWEHKQEIELRGLKTYIHDKISFECEDETLSEALKGCILRYQFEVLLEEASKKVTQKIQTIQQKIA